MATEVLTGVPGSGKTTRLIETLQTAERSGRRVVTFYCKDMPGLDANSAVREHGVISARVPGLVFPVHHLATTAEAAELLAAEEPGTLVAFEEAQWFGEDFVPAWIDADRRGLDVLLTTPSRTQLERFDRERHRYKRTHLHAVCSVCERREARKHFHRDDDSISVCTKCARRLRRDVRRFLRERLNATASAAGGRTPEYPVELSGFRRWRATRAAQAEWDLLSKLVLVARLPMLNRPLGALVLGSDTGFVCHRLRAWGFGSIIGIEEDTGLVELARLVDSYFHRDHVTYLDSDPSDYLLRESDRVFDVVFASASFARSLARRSVEDRGVVLDALATRTGALCVFATEDGAYATELRGELATRSFAKVTRLDDAVNRTSRSLLVALKSNPDAQASRELAQLAYPTTVSRLRSLVNAAVPENATVVVISHGDDKLLDLDHRRGLHFPQDERGSFVGYYPATSGEAVEQLERLRIDGARYLVVPTPQLWWLDYYGGLSDHLARSYVELVRDADAGVIFELPKSFS